MTVSLSSSKKNFFHKRQQSRTRLRIRAFYVDCLLFCLCAAAASAQPYPQTPPEQITLQLKWRHQFQFAGYYAAVEKGFYREAGLEVELREGAPEINPSDEVLAGRAQFGVGGPALIIERNQGRPLVVLAAVFQHSPLAIFTLQKSGISTPQDLAGRRVWMRPVQEAALVVMLRNEGVSLDKIYIPSSFHGVNDLIDGRIDAIAGYVTDRPFEFEKKGLPYNIIQPLTYGVDFYGDCLFTSEHEIRENPGRVRAFVAASMKGWEYAMQHQAEMADCIFRKNPEGMTREQLLFEAKAMEKLIMPEFIELGHMNPGRWRHIGEAYVKAGLLRPGFSIDGLLYDPKAERYSAVIRQATYAAGIIAALVLLGLCIMLLFNRRLKFSVAQRTAALEQETAERRRAEEALKLSEAEYREIVENAGSIIMRFDRQGICTFLNEFAQRFFGYSPDEILGRHAVGTIVAETDAAGSDLAGMIERLIQKPKKFINNENENICRDGKRVWISWTNRPVIDADGNVVEILSIGHDVTERRRAEAALRESEERFRKLAEAAPIAIMIYQGDRWVYANPAGEAMCGYSSEELCSMEPWDFVHPDHMDFVRERALQRMRGESMTSRYEIKILTKTGEVGWVDLTAAFIEYNGAPAGIIAVIDITDRKRTEDALRENEALIRSMFEADPTGVSLTAGRGFKKANQRFCDITGYTEEELLGQSTRVLYADEAEFNRVGRELYQDLQERGYGSLESRWKRKDGEIIDVLLSISPLNPADFSAGLTSVAIDITDRKRMEKALEQRIIALTRPLDESAEINFELLFNVAEIQKLQDQFALATGVASIITHADGTPITQPSNFCRLCNDLIRKTEKGRANCYASDAAIGRYHPEGPRVQTCLSGGLWDAGASITVGGRHIANWLIGQVRNEAQDETAMRRYAGEIGVDEEAFMQAFYEVPAMPEKKFQEVAQALHTLAGQLSSMAYQNVQQARFISDLTLAEESLRESKEEVLNIINNSIDGIYLFDENGAILEWNSGCEQITGLARADALGRSIWDIYYDFIPDEGKNTAFRELFESAIRESFKTDTVDTSFSEFIIQCANGDRKIVQSSVFPIKTAKRTMRGVIARDITGLRKAEQEQIRLATAIEQADETIVITDKDGVIQYVNPAFERSTGYERSEGIGRNPRILKSGRQSAFFYRELWDTISGGKTWKGHFTNKKKDGSLFEEEATISPVKNAAGEIFNYVAVKRDVTQQLQLEEQVRQTQKLEAVGTLAGGIAHDFNNILTAIIGFTELSQGLAAGNSRLEQNLAQVLRAGERAKSLVKQILAFSRKSESELKPLQTHLILKEVLKLLRASLPSTINLRYSIDDKADIVIADATQIHQIVMNLCTNAAHAMQQAGGELEITLKPVELDEQGAGEYTDIDPGAYLHLSVKDTGTGIPQDIIGRIFEPFFTTKEAEKGTGMGLSVVHGIVKSLKGDIKVYSEAGRGTTFHVLLPRVEEAVPKGQDAAPELPRGTESVLLVDDEQQLLEVGTQILSSLGYRVTALQSPVEALELFTEDTAAFDLVITDQTMPQLTGYDLSKRLLQARPDLPIVLCTGYSDQVTEESALRLGIGAFIIKPLNQRVLAETIRTALDAAAGA